jgi:glycogen(starch) synthase
VRGSRILGVVDPATVEYVRQIDRSIPVEVVGNAVDVDTIRPGAKDREPMALYVGRLDPAKGVEDLLDAWPAIVTGEPAARLLVVGDGPLRAKLEDRATRLDIGGSVTFAGRLGADRRGELIDAYRRASVVVQPSLHEGLSTVVLEGMAAATPVVATDVGAHRWVIDSGTDGILIAPGRAEAIAAAVRPLIADSALARAMGLSGRKTVVERFSWAALADRHVSLYQAAIDSGAQ